MEQHTTLYPLTSSTATFGAPHDDPVNRWGTQPGRKADMDAGRLSRNRFHWSSPTSPETRGPARDSVRRLRPGAVCPTEIRYFLPAWQHLQCEHPCTLRAATQCEQRDTTHRKERISSWSVRNNPLGDMLCKPLATREGYLSGRRGNESVAGTRRQ